MRWFDIPEPPPYRKRLLAFIDIMGWGSATRSISSDSDLKRSLNAIATISVVAQQEDERQRQFRSRRLPGNGTLRSSHFSDTILYSCDIEDPDSPWLSFQIILMCSSLLERGFYTRGAIVVGDLAHDASHAVGEALVRAADLEKIVATYPRLIVSDEAERFLVSPGPRGVGPGPSQVRTDNDGLKYFDIMGTFKPGLRSRNTHDQAVRARSIVVSGLAGTADLSALSSAKKVEALKHRAAGGWALKYLDSVIADPIDPSPDDDADEITDTVEGDG